MDITKFLNIKTLPKKLLAWFLPALFLVLFATQSFDVYAEQSTENHVTEVQEYNAEHHNSQHEEGHGHVSFEPLFFIIFSIVIGAATKYFLSKSILPFTVSLLLIGIGLGALGRLNYLDIYDLGWFDLDFTFVDQSLLWASNIDPHLMLYIFLPILIFEAVFAIDVHVFKKTFTNAAIMAVPGILVAVFATALCVLGLKVAGIGLDTWTWALALLFGAIISATDPVAVVALLKDLGASKKLSTLIEGESLLNDGTAIVIFMVIFTGITGTGGEVSPFLSFIKVSFGGILTGIVIGWFIIKWIKKVFNDVLLETSLIVAGAYLTFFVAEHFFHVSGVLALVAFGIWIAYYGKTRISPEVQHFLHEFWELAAFVANVLIFIIVGVVIAERVVFTGNDVLLLFIIYIAIHIVRAGVIALFYPAMKRIGYGLDKKDATVLWYGALRGAIGLALALIVANTDSIDKTIRDEFLFFTAGIVTLTLIINATTIAFVVEKLGLTKLTPAKQLAIQNAEEYIKSSAEKNIDKLKGDRFLKRANWKAVRSYLPSFNSPVSDLNIDISDEFAELRKSILEKEKASYWQQFKSGLLSDRAYQVLAGEINDILDNKGHIPISERDDLENLLKPSNTKSYFSWVPFYGSIAQQMFFDKLTVSYDCAKGFVAAQEASLKLLESFMRTASDDQMEQLKIIEDEINKNRIEGLTFLRNLGKEYPETYEAIATREAIRSMLNHEKSTVEKLHKRGRLQGKEKDKMIAVIENKMKQLRDEPPMFEAPEEKDLIKEIPWLETLDQTTLNDVTEDFKNRVYSKEDVLLREGKVEDGMFIIVRGSIRIEIQGELIDVLGPGATIGEIAALRDDKRSATVIAETPLTVLWISSKSLKKLVAEHNDIEHRIWQLTAEKIAYYHFKDISPFHNLSENKLKKELKKGFLTKLEPGSSVSIIHKHVVLVSGKGQLDDEVVTKPGLLRGNTFSAQEETRLYSIEKLK